MKKNGKIIFLLVVVLVLGGYVFWFDHPDKTARQNKESNEVALWGSLKFADIKKIVADGESADHDWVLEKGEDGWLVVDAEGDKHPIVSEYLTSGWQEMEKTIVGEIVATNPENFVNFGVVGEKVLGLQFYTDMEQTEPVYEIKVGNFGPVYPSQYLLEQGKEKVLLVKSAFRSYFDRRRDDWRDRQLFRFSKDELAEISFSYHKPAERKYTLARVDGVWKITYPSVLDADESVVDSLIGALTGTSVWEFVPRSQSGDLASLGLVEKKDTYQVAWKKQDGQETVLWVGKKTADDSAYYARIEGNEEIYKITQNLELFGKQNLASLRKK